MTKLNQLFENSHKNVNINWHTPVKLTDNWWQYANINQDDIFLYKIIAKRGDKYRLLYIGMSEKQYIQDRLYNKDHRVKQQFMKDANKGWPLYCSLGQFILKDDDASFKWSKRSVKLIEKMLIIAHSEFPFFQNKKATRWFSSQRAWINIENSGFKEDGMFNMISYGLSST